MVSIKRFALFLCLVVVLSFLVASVESADFDLHPFHTKEEKIAMWKELWDSHSGGEYTSVGKTYDGMDIWLFSAGNPAGDSVLWDAEMHGGEDKGCEILFLMAKWLLESGDSRAVGILANNYVLFVPVVNDRIYRGNGDVEISPNGVDLNRNFETGWSYVAPRSDSYSYAGAYPVSEPETVVLRNVFSTYKPVFYVNMHCGAGPYAAYYSRSNRTLSEQAALKTTEICNEMGIVPYPTRVFGSNGFAIGDAVVLGVKSAWLIECVGSATGGLHLPEHYEELVNIYFPKCLALFIATCGLCAISDPTYIPPPTQDPSAPSTPTQYPSAPLVASSNSVKPRVLDTKVPIISVFSPANMSYNATQIQLEFAVNELVSWTAYCLGGRENVTITGNTTIPLFTDGVYSLEIFANDTVGNVGKSETILFNICQEMKNPTNPKDVSASVVVPNMFVVITMTLVSIAEVVFVIYLRKKRFFPLLDFAARVIKHGKKVNLSTSNSTENEGHNNAVIKHLRLLRINLDKLSEKMFDHF